MGQNQEIDLYIHHQSIFQKGAKTIQLPFQWTVLGGCREWTVHTTGGNGKCVDTLENSLPVPCRFKHTYVRLSSSTPQRNEKVCSHKNLYVNLKNGFIVNNWKHPKRSSTGVEGWAIVPLYHGIQLCSKSEQTSNACNDLNHKYMALSEGRQTWKDTYVWFYLYDIWKRQKDKDRKRTTSCQWLGLREGQL